MKVINCQLCGSDISIMGMVSHIRHKHRGQMTVDEYVSQFGEFRNPKAEPPQVPSQKVICKICNKELSIMGMAGHLKSAHRMTPDEYSKLNTEYRPKNIEKNKKLDRVGDKYKCLVCNVLCQSETELSFHVIKNHNLSKLDYVKNYKFPTGIPKCKCGCGQEVNILEQFPYFRILINGHGLKGELSATYGRFHGMDTLKKMSQKAIERQNFAIKSQDTAPELKFKEFLTKNSIDFKFQVATVFGRVDFYLPKYDLYVEIDGEYWHPTTLENLNIQLVSSAISQKNKEGISNLVRIRESDLDKLEKIEDLQRLNFKYNFDLDFSQIIVSKKYFQTALIDTNKAVNTLYKFIRAYQPSFPEIPARERIDEVIEKLSKFDFEKVRNTDIFKNNCSNLGVSFLKSKFKSYWKTSYKGSTSPIEAWENESIMRRIIKYRIGANNSKETFNFSLHQLVRGISAQRFTVSFFKPVLAGAIYKYFLGNKPNPVVFDPCCGFGGRMLGFKSLYPDGTYIGCEPNLETYLELMELAKNFEKVKIYNCKLEDFEIDHFNIDLTFTSIPYFDLETYSNPVKYENILEWENTFIKKLKTFPNLVLNIPLNLEYLFENYQEKYSILNNTSHFNKNSVQKTELLLKL